VQAATHPSRTSAPSPCRARLIDQYSDRSRSTMDLAATQS
jgi:hypothetical protein